MSILYKRMQIESAINMQCMQTSKYAGYAVYHDAKHGTNMQIMHWHLRLAMMYLNTRRSYASVAAQILLGPTQLGLRTNSKGRLFCGIKRTRDRFQPFNKTNSYCWSPKRNLRRRIAQSNTSLNQARCQSQAARLEEPSLC